MWKMVIGNNENNWVRYHVFHGIILRRGYFLSEVFLSPLTMIFN